MFPAPGATGVVLNPALVVVLERTSFERTPPRRAPPEPPALGEGLLLRDDAGRLIAVGPLVALETPRPIGATRALDDARVEIATNPVELARETHYEVLSRVAVCAGAGDARVACLQDEFVVIGDFTTGTELDRTPPAITSVEVKAGPGECLLALSVTAFDDRAPPDALRFQSFGLALLGPNLIVPAPEVSDREGVASLALTPIDPSNNRGLTFIVEVGGCLKPDVQSEDGFDDYLGPETAPMQPRRLGDRGCAFAGSPSADDGTGSGVLAALLALVVTRGARRAPSLGRATTPSGPSAPRAPSFARAPSSPTSATRRRGSASL